MSQRLRGALPDAWTRCCLRHPAVAWALIGALSVVALIGTLRIDTEAGYRALLGVRHPAIARLDEVTHRFRSGLSLAVVWWCGEAAPCESTLDPASLAMAHALSGAVEALPGVTRIDSPSTSPLWIPADLGAPQTARLVDNATGHPSAKLDTLRAHALRDEAWRGQILSSDGGAAALVIHLTDSDSKRASHVVRVLREQLPRFEAQGFRFALVGGPVEFVVAGAELASATAQMIPWMVLLTGLALLAFFRRPGPALASLLGVAFALLWTLGAQGWLGWPQTSLSQALPPLVLVIGVCDSIHLLSVYAASLSTSHVSRQRKPALIAAAAQVAAPCLLTTLTTIAGFLSFGVADLESFVHFGSLAALGSGTALFASFCVVPLVANTMPADWIQSPTAHRLWQRGLGVLASLPRRGAFAVLAIAAAAAGFTATGLPRLETDARFEDLYGAKSQVVRWVRDAEERLRSAETLEIAIILPPGQKPTDSSALAVLMDSEVLAKRPPLGPAFSLLTPMRSAHRLLHGNDLDTGLAADRERGPQMARLVRFRAPTIYASLADDEKAAYRLSVQGGKIPQRELRQVLVGVQGRLAAALPTGSTALLTGPLAVVSEMIDSMRRAQLLSFSFAALCILVLVCLFLRSIGLGLAAMIPTLLPIATTLGAMGWLGVRLDVGSAMVATVVLGIAIDDAIHFLYGYRHARQTGLPVEDALRQSLYRVGTALIATTLALAIGFTALALSPWAAVSRFGAVTAVALVSALLADLVVLPALLFATRRRP